jgi:hypothetical protein
VTAGERTPRSSGIRFRFSFRFVALPDIPEVADELARYSVPISSKPQYAITGAVRSDSARCVMAGLLATASNQFHAYLLRNALRRLGHADIRRTEFHPDGKFKLGNFMRNMER